MSWLTASPAGFIVGCGLGCTIGSIATALALALLCANKQRSG
jgi:hypothetical protein